MFLIFALIFSVSLRDSQSMMDCCYLKAEPNIILVFIKMFLCIYATWQKILF